MISDALLETMQRQEEILSTLWSLIVKQREALKKNDPSDLQSIMAGLRQESVRSQAIEAKRERLAEELAKQLDCEPIVSEMAKRLIPEEAEPLKQTAKALIGTVGRLRSEMELLPRLMEEARLLNEMTITEWRRLTEQAMGPGVSGGFDARI